VTVSLKLDFKGFSLKKLKNLKSTNFRIFFVFFRKTLKIQILDLQPQQKIVAFKSISCLYSYF